MSTATEPVRTTTTAAAAVPGRWWFAGNAVVAWAAFLFEAVLTVGNVYPATGAKPGEIDYHSADGVLGTLGHLFDFLWFFTNWSVLLVAVVTTMLALGRGGTGPVFRAVRLSSLVMIVVTALVYAVLLGPTATTVGLLGPSNTLRHVVVPAVTLLVFLVAGPRDWIRWGTLPASLVIPIAWVVYTLVRGSVVDAWPYGFINVDANGWASVGTYVVAILALGLVIGAVLYGVDALVVRLLRRRRTTKA